MSKRAVLLLSLLCATGCVAESAEEEEAAESVEEEIATTDVLRPAQIAELRGAGFDQKEIDAVARSVTISEKLAVQSFVDESNDPTTNAGVVRRESHGKAQGCLRARFDVTTRTGAGVFAEDASYPAWIRLSNGGAFQKSDKSKHISRGWGIKLLGVPGTRSGTQDFLFITSPRFFIHDVTHYPAFLSSTGNGRIGLLWTLFTKLDGDERDVIFHRLKLKVRNLLESPEYSAVPYAYGNQTVKYAVSRCDSGPPPKMPASIEPPDDAGPDYLEDAMDATLRARDVCYGFYVQKRGDDPVDNPTKAWDGPFERVATITIPRGQHKGGAYDYRANDDVCQAMAFDPWNAQRANRPVGKTNWTRKIVYAALADFRRVRFPRIYARWLANKNDPTIRKDFRNELKRLERPSTAKPDPQPTTEPVVDAKFKALGLDAP